MPASLTWLTLFMTCVGKKNENVWINPHEMKVPKIAPDLRVGLDGEPPLLLTLSHLGLQGVEKDGEEVKDVVEVDDEMGEEEDDALDSGSKKRMKSFFRSCLSSSSIVSAFPRRKERKEKRTLEQPREEKSIKTRKLGQKKKQSRIKL